MARPVVFLSCAPPASVKEHDAGSKRATARRAAELLGLEFAGDYDAATTYGAVPYFVPDETLLLADAGRLGIRGPDQLLGGVVPHPFLATKVITHGLVHDHAQAPRGWQPAFADRVREVVLPGFSAFAPADARGAGKRLLASGPVRLKRPCGVGGRGQAVVQDDRELDAGLDAIEAAELGRDGIVLELDLRDVSTLSVGQALLGDILISYCGTQRLTPANDGTPVYGGSELLVARGDWDALLQLPLPPRTRVAIAQTRTYHDAANSLFQGMFASRSNYDVAQGLDASGRRRSGVLEQSWRIGGATGAELAAIQAFQADAALQSIRASTTEVHGDFPPPPQDALIYFRGTDPVAGALIKYARLHRDADS